MNWKVFKIGAAVALGCAAAILGLSNLDGWPVPLFDISVVVVFLGAPMFLCGLVFKPFAPSRSALKTECSVHAAGLVLLVLVIAANFASQGIWSWRVAHGKRISEANAGVIARYRQARGRCPANLAEMMGAGYQIKVPHLARAEDYYQASPEGDRFRLLLIQDTGFLPVWHIYISETHTWESRDGLASVWAVPMQDLD